jgi:hypothetical protein
LHESHDEGGFGIPNNTITRLAASYTINTRFVAFMGTFACPAQQVWLPGNDFLQHYDCTDQQASAQPAPLSGVGGGAAANVGANPQPQHPGSQDNGNGKLVLPQLNRLLAGIPSDEP